MSRFAEFTLRPSDGGRLITTQAPENIGPENYVEKSGWRRVDDGEQLREAFDPVGVDRTGVLGLWEATRPNGEHCLVFATASAVYRIDGTTQTSLGAGFSATAWQGESIDGYLVLNNGVDLPVYYRVEDPAVTPLYELRDVGVASVDTMEVANGFLLFGGVKTVVDLATWMNGASPYGKVTASTNHIRYRITWSDYGKPTNFAPVYSGTIASSDRYRVTLAWPTSVLKVGDKLAVTNAGPNGSILGGQTQIPDGVAISGINGNVITLAVPADAALTYPLSVEVTRYADTSTFAGSSTIQDDSSAILRIKKLKKRIVVYRETGVFTGYFTGSKDYPFKFEPGYQTKDVPLSGAVVADVNGEYHVYPTPHKRFVYFDGSEAPRVHRPLDDASNLFFTGLTTPNIADNRETKELWFCNGTTVLAYDYHAGTVSTVPFAVRAAVQSRDGFYAFDATRLLKQNMAAYCTFPATLRSGFGALKDDHSQKVLRQFGPVFLGATPTDSWALVTLYGRDTPDATTDMLTMTAIPANTVTPLTETFFRNVYFQDHIDISARTTSRIRMIHRLYRIAKIHTSGKTRT